MLTIVEQEIAPEVLTERERRARVLEAAALEIEVRGWAHCDMDSRGRVCANGALAVALGVEPALIQTDKGALIDALNARQAWDEGYHPYTFIASFNDMRADDAQDVTFVLRWRAQEIRDGR